MTAPTRDEVIAMAREAGTPDPMVFFLDAYECLVAAAYARGVADEREACAKTCEAKALTWRVRPVPLLGYAAELDGCAAAIRARNGT